MTEKRETVQELAAKRDDLLDQLRLVKQEIASRHGQEPEPEPKKASTRK